MGIMDRVATVVKSNLNHLINKAEDRKDAGSDPIQMRQQLVEAKRAVAVAIADEKRLAARLEAELEQVREWERRATMAVQG
jgi:phage shock protein A